MLDYLLEKSILPRSSYKIGIHHQIHQRLQQEKKLYQDRSGENKRELIQSLKKSDIALSTTEANQQHYEVPTEFYQAILGPALKYSCCSYQKAKTLEEAEIEMLSLYCERAQIENGQSILDLGCGWGSFSLYAAKRYPDSHITAVSNSSTQKAYIQEAADRYSLNNITVITQDINQLQLTKTFDRIISIEMFEHIRNYQELLEKISTWLKPQGLVFIHHFCHQYLAYPFNAEDSWMARHFFQDGLMPSEDTLMFFQDHLSVVDRWQVNGQHYERTCYHWLQNLYQNKNMILKTFEQHYDKPLLRYQYWDLFIRACAQLFGFKSGNEWFVTHYLFKKS